MLLAALACATGGLVLHAPVPHAPALHARASLRRAGESRCALEEVELLSRPLTRRSAAEAATFLQQWSRRFLRGGEMKSPPELEELPDGVLMRYIKRAPIAYAEIDPDDVDPFPEKGTWPKKESTEVDEPDGALRFVVAGDSEPSVVVSRAEMDGVTIDVVKERLELSILTRLEQGLLHFESELMDPVEEEEEEPAPKKKKKK